MTNQTKESLSNLFNLLIVILVSVSVFLFFVKPPFPQEDIVGATCFFYFTTDSNLLLSLSSLYILLYRFFGKRLPKSVYIFKFVGTFCVMVTFFTVAFFLSPTLGFKKMFTWTNLVLHFFCPMLALISFLFFEKFLIQKKHIITSLIPVAIYGLVYFIMVVAIGKDAGGWEDFYGFNKNGLWYVTILIITPSCILLSFLLTKTHNYFSKNHG